MRRFRSLLAALVLTAPTVGAQQTTSCPVAVADACQKSADLFTYLAPQFGAALSGGNLLLGSGEAHGRFGLFSLGLRVSALNGSLPDVAALGISETGARADDVPVTEQFVPMPAVDATLGLFPGIVILGHRVAAIDAAVSALYLPSIEGEEGTELRVQDNLKLGYGLRVGLLQGWSLVPDLTFTVLQRGVPTLSVLGETEDGYRVGVRELAVDVTSWRLMASTRFAVLGLNVGAGSDALTTSGGLIAQAPNGGVSAEAVSLDRDVTRSVLFAGLTLDLGPVALAGEVGRTSGSGTALRTVNRFDPAADAARTFASVGVRIGF
jgi:hypothetical protein